MCNEADVPVLSAASGSERLTDLVMGYTPSQLVNLAVTHLMPQVTAATPNLSSSSMGLTDASAFNARAMTFHTAQARS
jgi:hypothetical protein